VQVLLVNQRVFDSGAFERWTNDYASLNAFLDPVPAPFQNLTSPTLGVHLHWKLPAALTHGMAASGSSNVEFPCTPNRWLVMRLATTAGATTASQMNAWIIQSDYMNPSDGTTPFANPFKSTPASVDQTLLGKHWTLEAWQAEPGGLLFLTATGTADMMFTAFEPGLLDVYAFHDDTTGLAGNTLLTYLVAGWFSDPAYDPLATSTPAQLNWTVLGGDSAPDLSVFHGLVFDLLWQTDSIPPRRQ
jgi:hypothetical protein